MLIAIAFVVLFVTCLREEAHSNKKQRTDSTVA